MSLTQQTIAPDADPKTFSALAALTDRLFTIASSNYMAAAFHVSEEVGGLALAAGQDALKHLRKVRAAHPAMILAVESRAYETYATEEVPFIMHDDDGLFGDPLTDLINGQLDAGASFAILPAGYVAAGDTDTLRAIADRSNLVERDDVTLLLVLDPQFLENDLQTLIAVINSIQHPVLVAFGAKSNPLSSKKKRASYRELFAKTRRAFPWRTDIAGIDAMVFGARGAGVGMLPSQRRANLPNTKGFSPDKSDLSPNMLLGNLLRYIKSSHLRRLFASITPPTCPCGACKGRAIDRLSASDADRLQGHLHDMLEMQSLHADLLAAEDKHAWWDARLALAVGDAEALGAKVGQKVAVPAYVTEWQKKPAKEPAPAR